MKILDGLESLFHCQKQNMKKSALIRAIAAQENITAARAELVVNRIFDALAEAMERGEGIKICAPSAQLQGKPGAQRPAQPEPRLWRARARSIRG